jgi:hypothetical protein
MVGQPSVIKKLFRNLLLFIPSHHADGIPATGKNMPFTKLRNLCLYVLLPCLTLVSATLPARELSAASIRTPEEVIALYIIKMHAFIKIGTPANKIQSLCYYERPDIPLQESVGQLLAQKYPTTDSNAFRVKRLKAISRFTGCDAVFIPRAEEANWDSMVAAIGSSPILTLSDMPQFVLRGGMIGFIQNSESRIKMQANIKNLRAHRVQVNPQVLELMQDVVGRSGE